MNCWFTSSTACKLDADNIPTSATTTISAFVGDEEPLETAYWSSLRASSKISSPNGGIRQWRVLVRGLLGKFLWLNHDSHERC